VPPRWSSALSIASGLPSRVFRHSDDSVTTISARDPKSFDTIVGGNESGKALTFHFCPACGSTVYWESESFPGYIAVAVGNFADPDFPAPSIAVWEQSRHPWVSLPPDTPPQRAAKQG